MNSNRALLCREVEYGSSVGLLSSSSSSSWSQRNYRCSFCKKEFKSAQALGGHMNVHRRDRAKMRLSPLPSPSPSPSSSSFHTTTNPNPNPNITSSSSTPYIPNRFFPYYNISYYSSSLTSFSTTAARSHNYSPQCHHHHHHVGTNLNKRALLELKDLPAALVWMKKESRGSLGEEIIKDHDHLDLELRLGLS